MKQIILDEAKYAEHCLKYGAIDDKPFYTLTVLAKYYYYKCGYKRKKIISLLTDFMGKYYPRYIVRKMEWDESIDKIATNVRKYKLYEIEGVHITKSEMKAIQAIHNKMLERLAFTMLCLAKLSHLKNERNQGWVNESAKDIFRLARITCSAEERDVRLGRLGTMGYLEFANKITNLSCRVTFMDDNSPHELFVSDFRELGYEYRQYCGEKFIECQRCGILMPEARNRGRKYCPDCSGYIPQVTKAVKCIDCGKEFYVNSLNNESCRCEECYKKYRTQYYRKNKREQRQKAKCPQHD